MWKSLIASHPGKVTFCPFWQSKRKKYKDATTTNWLSILDVSTIAESNPIVTWRCGLLNQTKSGQRRRKRKVVISLCFKRRFIEEVWFYDRSCSTPFHPIFRLEVSNKRLFVIWSTTMKYTEFEKINPIFSAAATFGLANWESWGMSFWEKDHWEN
jgi:hypothetical protein